MTNIEQPPPEYWQNANVYLMKWLMENHPEESYYVRSVLEPERSREKDWKGESKHWMIFGDDIDGAKNIEGLVTHYGDMSAEKGIKFISFPREVCWEAFSYACGLINE